jgi:predicted nucleotidyltransferase
MIPTRAAIDEYMPPGKRIVSITEVGSGMWGMREISSDYDIVVVYSENMADYMAGRKYEANLPFRPHIMIDSPMGDKEFDFAYMEVGHLVNLIKKGNINALWATLSPIVIATSDLHQALVKYVRRYPTKSVMPSLEGMVQSQLSDAVKRAEVRPPKKSIMTAMRTVQFGMNLCNTLNYKFDPISGDISECEVRRALKDLKDEMDKSEFLVDTIPSFGIEETLLCHRLYYLEEDMKRPCAMTA